MAAFWIWRFERARAAQELIGRTSDDVTRPHHAWSECVPLILFAGEGIVRERPKEGTDPSTHISSIYLRLLF